MDSLLSTGEVARRLGSSRQHVVDMCDRGDLPSCAAESTAGCRRPQSSGSGKPGRPLTREEERSLWLHRVVVALLVSDPDATLVKAANLSAWRGVHRRDGMAEHWLEQWRELLDGGVDEVAEIVTSRDPQAIDLRQNSPFAGVVDEQTRRQVLTAFTQHWRDEHSAPSAA